VPLSALTSTARAALTRGRGPRHLLLALVDRPRPDPAAELLAELGVDPDEVRARLAV
jgi:hypothetical protein